MKTRVGVLLLTLALVAGSHPLTAQVGPPGGGGMRRGQQPERMQELERRLQARFGENVRARLGLDAETLQALQGVMQSFQSERQGLNRAQASLRYRLRDPALPDLPDAEARSFLQEMISLQEKELSLYRREQARLLEILTPTQLVLFYRLREELGQRIQQLRQGQGAGGGQGMGPGWPGVGGGGLPPGSGGGALAPLR